MLRGLRFAGHAPNSSVLLYPPRSEDAHMASCLERPAFWVALSPALFVFAAVLTYAACALWW